MSLETFHATARRNAAGPRPARFSDLVLVAGVVLVIAMMVLPLPPLAIDSLVAINITVGLFLLLMAIYIRTPVEFSVFPSVLLLTTLFRLSLSITTTRMILIKGQAGHIIDAFGHVVAGGNLVVGLVVFLIITVVQFIVIAKGAERVAEVAARFSLDAMPGKQLSIDSDLRSGLIDKDEARRRRRMLEQESKLHGSLDGAMKFVKGDAIAGIIIIVINLIGGLTVGVLQQGLELGQSMVKYSILTIGDGMVMQIPALLAAMAAGLIVTRTTDEEDNKHLGAAIHAQLSARPRALLVAGGICGLMAFVPGFPALVFVALGVVLASTGVLLTPTLRARALRVALPLRRGVGRAPVPMASIALAQPQKAQPLVPLLLQLQGPEASTLDAAALAEQARSTLSAMQQRLGIALPGLSIHVDPEAAEGQPTGWRLLAFEVPIAEGRLEQLADVGFSDILPGLLRRNAALFVGAQETSTLLSRAAEEYPDVVKETLRAVPVLKLADIFRRLVEEEVPIRDLRSLLETLADAGQREKDVFALVEFSRMALKRHLSHRYAAAGTLRALLLSPELEDHLRQAIESVGNQNQLSIEPAVARRIIQALRSELERHPDVVLLTTVDVRRHLRKLIEPDLFDLPVLSYHELVHTLKLEVVARVPLNLQLGSPLGLVGDGAVA